MKESMGYTVTLNIIIVFIIIIFAFLAASLSYFKANKIANSIRNSIETYEGYNSYAETDIINKIEALGYNMTPMSCSPKVNSKNSVTCDLVVPQGTIMYSAGQKGYCVYICNEGDYYYYKVGTNMTMNIPIINSILPIRIFSNSDRLYNFEQKLKP